jgi:tRNA uridine 5-carbamoylmethylation protein Kti12
VILDDNFYYKSMRRMFFKISKKYQTSFLLILFKVDIKICLNNNNNRENKINEDIIFEMNKKIEFDNDLSCEIFEFDNNYENLILIIKKLLNKQNLCDNNYKNNDINHNINKNNYIHYYDLKLRKDISKKLKEFKGTTEEKKDLSLKLIEEKNEILKELRK